MDSLMWFRETSFAPERLIVWNGPGSVDFIPLCFGCRYGKPVVSCCRSLREMASGLQATRELHLQTRSRYSLLCIYLDLCFDHRNSSSLWME